MAKKKNANTRNTTSNAKRTLAREFGSEIASATIGTGTVFGAISGAGIGGLGASGITSGLAALGAGSMLGGILVAPALGYGAYRLSKWAFSVKAIS